MPIGMRARTAAPSRRATSGARRTRAKRCTGGTRGASRCWRRRGRGGSSSSARSSQRGDDEREVLVEVDAELLGARADLVAVDRGGEAGCLSFFLTDLGVMPWMPSGRT